MEIRSVKRTATALLLAGCLAGLTACGGQTAPGSSQPAPETIGSSVPGGAQGSSVPEQNPVNNPSGTSDKDKPFSSGGASDKTATDGSPSGSAGQPADSGNKSNGSGQTSNGSGQTPAGGGSSGSPGQSGGSGKASNGSGKTGADDAIQVVAAPSAIAVLVNKTYKLPDNYKPDDLVEPEIPFIFSEKSDKRLMRKEAAGALEKLVAAAKKDGVSLAGVSGFRSQATQKSLFERYVKKDGEEAARKYSAVPGHSEHQTGLAMDVSGSDGKCAASDCFAGTKEATWLDAHAHEHGFIIRYPKGKEDITGYQYEPWHLRYVGAEMAKEIHDEGITLEEYMEQAATKASAPAAR